MVNSYMELKFQNESTKEIISVEIRGLPSPINTLRLKVEDYMRECPGWVQL